MANPMLPVLTRLSGLLALALSLLGLWFSYVLPVRENGFAWVYLQVVVYIAFAVPSLLLLAASLLGRNRYLAWAVTLVLGLNALAFAVTPYLPRDM